MKNNLFFILSSLIGCTFAAKIPIKHVPLSYPVVQTMKDRLMNQTLVTEILGDTFPVKDYMNTQYFIEVMVGTPP